MKKAFCHTIAYTCLLVLGLSIMSPIQAADPNAPQEMEIEKPLLRIIQELTVEDDIASMLMQLLEADAFTDDQLEVFIQRMIVRCFQDPQAKTCVQSIIMQVNIQNF